MKKIILSLPVFLLLFYTVNAQKESTTWLTLVTGLNSNWIVYQNAYGNPELEYSTTFGFNGGLGFNYFISDTWGFSGTLLATKMGQNYAGVQSGGDADRKVNLSYLEIPLVLMKHIPYNNNPTWITFGPDILVLMKAEQEYRRVGGVPLPNPEGMKVGDIRERFNPTDVALTFSYNKMYPLDTKNSAMFLLTFNTAFGLTDINDIEWKIPQLDGTYTGSHNFYIGIKAGLMFNLSKDKSKDK